MTQIRHGCRRARRAPLLVIPTIVIAATAIATADVKSTVRLYEGSSLVSPGVASTAFTYDCDFGTPYDWGIIGGVSLNLNGSSNGNFAVSIKAEFATTPEELLQNALEDEIADVIGSQPCTFGITEDLGVLRGNISLYSFAVGGGSSGGFEVKRRAIGELAFDDVLDVTSPRPQSLEMPLSISGSVFAAESFGDPERNEGTASLSMSGSVAGTAVNEQVSVTSDSIFPAEGSINVARRIPVNVGTGSSAVSVHVLCRSEVISTAVSTGFFGSISGAVTAGADFPNSIHIGTLRTVGGGPLAPGTVVRLRSTGRVVQASASECRADFNSSGAVSVQDIFDYLAAWFAGNISADFNGDRGVTAQDLFDFLGAWFAGC